MELRKAKATLSWICWETKGNKETTGLVGEGMLFILFFSTVFGTQNILRETDWVWPGKMDSKKPVQLLGSKSCDWQHKVSFEASH